jgi:predicted nucleotide-binding protein
VLVAGPDDEVTSRGTTAGAPRDNVVFELGLFMGALSRSRTFVCVPGGVALKIPSDLKGMTNIKYDGAATDPATAVEGAVLELLKLISTKGPR